MTHTSLITEDTTLTIDGQDVFVSVQHQRFPMCDDFPEQVLIFDITPYDSRWEKEIDKNFDKYSKEIGEWI